MAPHSRILAWRIPWTEESGGLQSIGLQTVGHDWVTNTLFLYGRNQHNIVNTFLKKQRKKRIFFLCLWVCFCFLGKFIFSLFEIPHISDIIYLSVSVWLIALSVIISRSIHVAASGIISYFVRLSPIPLYICTSSFSSHLWMDTWVASSWHLWISMSTSTLLAGGQWRNS